MSLETERPAPDVYLREFRLVARRAWSAWNREPSSPSFGSFDRAYWGWKYRDFSDATKQQALLIAVEYAASLGFTATLPVLIEGFVGYCHAIQRRDGSFDQCYPNEKTPGVVYDLLPTLLYVRSSPFLVSAPARARLDEVMERAVRFALSVDETHGQVANHIAAYAYTLLAYAKATGERSASAGAERYLSRLMSLFDPDEGWFQEYSGPDPGYQTRTLRYLVNCALILGQPPLWSVAERAARFIETMLMPDGSLHPMLGTRSTALLYPSGFEVLAVRDSAFAPLAERVRRAWADGVVPLASSLDFENAIPLAADLLAAAAAGTREVSITNAAAGAERTERVDLDHAGITIVRDARRAVYVAHRLGGVVVAYGKDDDGCWRLRYEDSGYLWRDPGGDGPWLTRFPGNGRVTAMAEDRLVIEAPFCRSLHDEVTPLRLVVLRLLNMTLLRSQWIGDLFRKLVVRHLMSGRRERALVLRREIDLAGRELHIRDGLVGHEDRRGTLYACRRVTGTHMASSRYFQPQELEALPAGWCEPVSWPTSGTPLREVSVR